MENFNPGEKNIIEPHLKRILQRQLADYMILENVALPMRRKIVEAFLAGAEIERGPLNVRTPVFDDGPLVVNKNAREAERIYRIRGIMGCYESIKRAIQRGDFLKEEMPPRVARALRREAVIELELAANRLNANAWALWQERRALALRNRDWSDLRELVHQWIIINEATWLLWAATRALRYGLITLATKSAQAALESTAVVLTSPIGTDFAR